MTGCRRFTTIRNKLQLWIATTLMCLAIFSPTSHAIICYKCSILPPQYVGETNIPCSKFDGSKPYQQDCPTSTFCMKRIIHYRLPNGTMITTSIRNCASQTYNYHEFNYNDREWHKVEMVDTRAYAEGCFKGENRGAPNGPSEYCYCSSDFCNKSLPMVNPLNCSLLVTAVLIALKLL